MAAVVGGNGRVVERRQPRNTEQGFMELVDLLVRHRVARVGIEGAGNFGRAIAVHMAIKWAPDRDVQIVEVPL